MIGGGCTEQAAVIAPRLRGAAIAQLREERETARSNGGSSDGGGDDGGRGGAGSGGGSAMDRLGTAAAVATAASNQGSVDSSRKSRAMPKQAGST